MFTKNLYERIAAWKEFRKTLEESLDPYQEVIDYYKLAPMVRIQADPYDENTWPTPWEIIEENVYCDFVKILAICYTLKLTDRFSQDSFEIHITQDKKNSQTNYLLLVNGLVIGYDKDRTIPISKLPPTLTIVKRQLMSHQQ